MMGPGDEAEDWHLQSVRAGGLAAGHPTHDDADIGRAPVNLRKWFSQDGRALAHALRAPRLA